MSTKLERLIESIAAETTLKPKYELANEAVNSFAFPDLHIDNFDKFKYLLICLQRHIEAAVLQVDSMPGAAVDFHWSRCYEILRQIYGVNGEKAAFDIIRTNREGGLRKVVDKFVIAISENYAINEIRARIAHYLNSLSARERLNAAEEYMEKFGYLLPGEMVEAGAARIHDNFAKVLENHVFMAGAMGNTMDRF